MSVSDSSSSGPPVVADGHLDHTKGDLPKIQLMAYWSTFLGICTAFVVALAVWLAGGFDQQLASAGLNVHDCSVNIAGTVLCGRQLDTYKALVKEQQSKIDQAINSDGSSTATGEDDFAGDGYCDSTLGYDVDC